VQTLSTTVQIRSCISNAVVDQRGCAGRWLWVWTWSVYARLCQLLEVPCWWARWRRSHQRGSGTSVIGALSEVADGVNCAVAHGSRCGELIEVRAIFPCRVQRGEHMDSLVGRERRRSWEAWRADYLRWRARGCVRTGRCELRRRCAGAADRALEAAACGGRRAEDLCECLCADGLPRQTAADLEDDTAKLLMGSERVHFEKHSSELDVLMNCLP